MSALRPPAALRPAGDLVRGALIGVVEVIPGVSGGTVALIIGVYATLIDAASHVVRGIVGLGDGVRGRGWSRSARHFRAVRWRVVAPVLIGMVLAVVAGARLLAPLVAAYPVQTRAVFAGLIAASLLVPIRMLGTRWTWRLALLAAGAAVAAFVLTGLPAAVVEEPSLVVVALAASVAICALVLPGMSGAFLLLVFGLYETTLIALNERDVPYLLAFAVGAVVGLSLFVNLLRYLLGRYEEVMLALMTGLMLGSLRALWPWQDAEGRAEAPSGDILGTVLLVVAASALVLAVLALQRMTVRRG
jgi:putative membrane protein